jgi:hypothetical protein
MTRPAPADDYEALVTALVLALSGPSNEHSRRAFTLAEKFAAGMEPATVDAAKAEALVAWKEMREKCRP